MRLYTKEISMAKQILTKARDKKVLMIEFVYKNAYTRPVKLRIKGRIMQIIVTNGDRMLERNITELIKHNHDHIFINRFNLWKFVKRKSIEGIQMGKAFYEECKKGLPLDAFEKAKNGLDELKDYFSDNKSMLREIYQFYFHKDVTDDFGRDSSENIIAQISNYVKLQCEYAKQITSSWSIRWKYFKGKL